MPRAPSIGSILQVMPESVKVPEDEEYDEKMIGGVSKVEVEAEWAQMDLTRLI